MGLASLVGLDSSPKLSQGRRSWVHPLAAAVILLFLVLILWVPFNVCSGMPYETSFAFNSENGPFWEGFLYLGDHLRIHTSIFYHFSYLLGEALGIGGSFLSYQIVYALLWWARGLLVFLILRRLLPDYPLFAYLSAAICVVHASDLTLQWIGQLNQLGFIFWMLLAVYCWILALQQRSVRKSMLCLFLAVLFEYMSLWSYESQLFLILAAPAAVWVADRRMDRRVIVFAGAWYLIPVVYVYQTVIRFLHSGGDTYQQRIMRTDWSARGILGDWIFNIGASLGFWRWPGGMAAPDQGFVAAGVAAAAVFVAGVVAIALLNRRGKTSRAVPHARQLLAALAVGLILLVLSFPVYLILNDARSLWRTQTLSSLAASLTLAAAASLLVCWFPRDRYRLAGLAVCGAAIVFLGGYAAVKKGASHYRVWERHRHAVEQVLEAAPRVKDGTVILLFDVPRGHDPFIHNMWFDMAMRLAYPRAAVLGAYFLDDGQPGPGNMLELQDGASVWTGKDYGVAIPQAPLEHTLALRYHPDGAAEVLREIPRSFLGETMPPPSYSPDRIIEPEPPSPRAVRRYYPCEMGPPLGDAFALEGTG